MKGKATMSRGLPDEVVEAFRSDEFARGFVIDVIEGVFGVKYARFRPAAFYAQAPDEMGQVEPDFYGVIFTLSGVTRSDVREPKRFHDALRKTRDVCVKALQRVLHGDQTVHLFINMMLAGDVPMPPEFGGGYSNVHETPEAWVTSDGVYTSMPSGLQKLMDERLKAERDDIEM